MRLGLGSLGSLGSLSGSTLTNLNSCKSRFPINTLVTGTGFVFGVVIEAFGQQSALQTILAFDVSDHVAAP